jgi:membrane protease YdiL (CAAX protease family)
VTNLRSGQGNLAGFGSDMLTVADEGGSRRGQWDVTTPWRVRRKRRPPPRVDGWTVRYALSAYLVVLAVAVIAAVALTVGQLRLGVGVFVVDGVMIATLVPLSRTRGLRGRELGLRPSEPVRSVGLVFLSVIAFFVVSAVWGHATKQAVTPFAATLHESIAAKVLGGFAVVVCAPVVEEIFFRGLLYRSLRNRMSVPRAAIVAGVLFGAAHATTYPLHTLPPKLAFGIIACLLYEYSGSLYPGIALHCFVDAVAFEFAISGHDAVVFPVFLVLGASLLLYGGIRRRRPARS